MKFGEFGWSFPHCEVGWKGSGWSAAKLSRRTLTQRGRVLGDEAATYERNGDGSVTGVVLALRAARRRARGEPTGVEVVSTVSHELRSPLTSVKGYTSLLLKRFRFGRRILSGD